ncbi:hypothetical protein GL273_06000 [Aeromonas jandaei]|uniref:hypothetical protein n=1 Tax=Aeromonas jandaei TaxID=650 RepID=UPI001C5BCF82|nr:hypothetical protein [Aeromonas jandaei]MBW3805376.1 hypothetical protein [Aeromonas jandaei]
MSVQSIYEQLNTLRVCEKPYSDHYAAGLDETTHSHYSALLLMVLLSRDAISEQQQRMLDLWLPSIGLSGQQAMLLELAVSLAKNRLGDAIQLLKQDPLLFKALLLDIMIFSRINNPLDKQTISLLEVLVSYLELADSELGDIVYLAVFILGLSVDSLSEPSCDMDLTPYQVWSEFLYHYRPNAAKRLFAWADENGIPSSNLPRSLNALSRVKKLSNLDYKREDSIVRWSSIPEEIYLLENIELLTIDSHRLTDISPSIGKLKNIKYLTLLSLNVTSLPKELTELRSLQRIKIEVFSPTFYYLMGPVNKLTFVPRELVQFIKLNGIELDVSPSIELLFK